MITKKVREQFSKARRAPGIESRAMPRSREIFAWRVNALIPALSQKKSLLVFLTIQKREPSKAQASPAKKMLPC